MACHTEFLRRFDCDGEGANSCRYNEKKREFFGCETIAKRPHHIPGTDIELWICPVRFIDDIFVRDVIRAYTWYRKGQLALLEPHPSAKLIDAITVIEQEIQTIEDTAMDEIQARGDEIKRGVHRK